MIDLAMMRQCLYFQRTFDREYSTETLYLSLGFPLSEENCGLRFHMVLKVL